ncbi:MAG: dTDP-4-dehydrorhamnose 3,5-epimerase [Limnobacter sp. CACIAM 66H1]|uniref:dTDP-4-dehydrorhamnose 3,5-epimerase n=1 Tax=Limnobacter sp. CACIAM 66H1 TaxID=1813033 RepID=UPI0007A83336|nr:dTDP-4-dehydrorhamnose 3,5-epimerase [Limnobacter sp. CACIAM 66H1]KYP10056.1 MAG: dTDP-4-dehydrorhamnose 3,5-epimerase [Limnobacter sp. CACIAM 66H1]
MKVIQTKLEGVCLLEPTVFSDSRGYFFESFNDRKFEELTGFPAQFVQDNQSMSARGVLRGLHFQISPKAQGKLVRVVKGAVFDVAVDIRSDSPTYGQWVGFELSEFNHRQLWIPPGLAHGFVALQDNTVFQYKVTEYWSKDHERCIAWNDPDLGIDWQFEGEPMVSAKDVEGLSLASFGR